MNYRHAFHAGNFADVFKHALLARMLVYLAQKPAPLRYIDTHAGLGRYDLASPEAQRTGEWRSGIGRILAEPPPDAVAALLQPWLDCLGPSDAEHRPSVYPGSPELARRLLRGQDRLSLFERHPVDASALSAAMQGDPRVRVTAQDGYAGLNALAPPPERRGLVLIDPPFEARDEFTAMTQALVRAHRKWATGVYALWYPVKQAGAGEAFAADLRRTGVPRILRVELAVGGAEGLSACGMAIVNPPFPLQAEAAILLPFFAARLRVGLGGHYFLDWVSGE